MKLHFPWPAIEQALETLRAAGAVRTLYDQDTGKGFWLVGDQGVYLMPNKRYLPNHITDPFDVGF